MNTSIPMNIIENQALEAARHNAALFEREIAARKAVVLAEDERVARAKLARKMSLARVVIKSHRPKFTIPARSALPKNGACKRGRR